MTPHQPATLEETDGAAAGAPLSREALRDVLTTALRAGQIMVENGANTARVEETVHRVGTALGAAWMEVYATPTGIVASAVSGGEHRTRIQRITAAGVDLSKIAAVLDVSRRAAAGELDREATRDELERIAHRPRVYGPLATTAAVALACGCFAVLFGGGAWELLVALLVSALSHPLRLLLLRARVGPLLAAGVTATFASSLALLLAAWLPALAPAVQRYAPLLPPPTPDRAITGAASVVLLVPGVVMVSSIADLFRGDTISGVARATTAMMTIGAIASGTWAALLLTGAQVDVAPATQPNLPLALGMALIGAWGFAVLFDVPRRALLPAALVGAAAYGVRVATLGAGLPAEAAIFAAGLAIGALAETLARLMRLPTMIFTIPGFIPLVPGVLAFVTMLQLVNGSYEPGVASLVRTALLTAALAVGLGTVGALARVGRRT
ncbi:MAG TPA: threonine/serine exporter family protein [Roseiflexaceae bacterium]|nr:threonine/serine exporter family protein [Roseiflexaceae bacterium]